MVPRKKNQRTPGTRQEQTGGARTEPCSLGPSTVSAERRLCIARTQSDSWGGWATLKQPIRLTGGVCISVLDNGMTNVSVTTDRGKLL